MSDKYSGTVVTKLADQVIPDEFIELALKTMPTTAGFAVAVENGETGMIKCDGSSEGDVTLDQVNQMQEDYKDSTCVFYFSIFPSAFSPNCAQPFIALEEDGAEGADLVVFIEMDEASKPLPASKNSPEFDTFMKFIKPALVRIWKSCNQDITETMQEIATDPGLPDLIGMLYDKQATVLMLGANGEMISFGRNEAEVSYDWGTASATCGYGDKKTVVEKVAETVRRGMGSGRLRGATAAASPSSSKVSEDATTSGGSEAEKYHAPPLNASKQEKGQWYLDNNEGIIPPGYKSCPKILKMEYRQIKSLKDKKLEQIAVTKRPIADVVPVRQKNGDKSVDAAKGKAVTTEVLPVVPPPQLKKLAEFMKTPIVGKNVNEGKSILDPERFVDMEKKYSSFPEVAGLKGLEETFPWIFEAYVKLGKDVGIEALALLAFNLTIAYQKYLAADDDAPAAEEEVNTEVVNDPPASRFSGSRSLRR